MSRRWRKPMGWFVVAAFVGAGLAAGWVCHDPGARPYVPIQGAKDGVPRAADVTPRPDVRLAAVDIQAINVLLANTANLRNDVLFLVIAAARDRCAPAEAGSLAQMANRAQLPVLSGVSQATEAHPALERPLYRYVQAAASAVECKRPFVLAGLQAIDPDLYAERFPDTFYAPARRGTVPSEYAGLNLQQRAKESCESVAYAVVPLTIPQWQCDAARSGARKRIVSYCVGQRGVHGLTLNAELTAAFGEAIAPGVAEIISSLPRTCLPDV